MAALQISQQQQQQQQQQPQQQKQQRPFSSTTTNVLTATTNSNTNTKKIFDAKSPAIALINATQSKNRQSWMQPLDDKNSPTRRQLEHTRRWGSLMDDSVKIAITNNEDLQSTLRKKQRELRDGAVLVAETSDHDIVDEWVNPYPRDSHRWLDAERARAARLRDDSGHSLSKSHTSVPPLAEKNRLKISEELRTTHKLPVTNPAAPAQPNLPFRDFAVTHNDEITYERLRAQLVALTEENVRCRIKLEAIADERDYQWQLLEQARHKSAKRVKYSTSKELSELKLQIAEMKKANVRNKQIIKNLRGVPPPPPGSRPNASSTTAAATTTSSSSSSSASTTAAADGGKKKTATPTHFDPTAENKVLREEVRRLCQDNCLVKEAHDNEQKLLQELAKKISSLSWVEIQLEKEKNRSLAVAQSHAAEVDKRHTAIRAEIAAPGIAGQPATQPPATGISGSGISGTGISGSGISGTQVASSS